MEALLKQEFKQLGRESDWWKHAVIYQVYPRSYLDSNGDGIGDIQGITQKLDYLQDLGIDAIWIAPFFPSPMKDFGYDVSEYCGIDPMFGTLEDFDNLIHQAHQRDIRIIIDLVISHTSDKHAWFQESRQDRDNSKSDWYVWADAKEDGTPPNNWLSIFGGSAWEWNADRQQYYLHNFLASQPDLNFHNQEVQEALFSIARFWLDRGVDGFRLDTINFYFHNKDLRDNPPLPKELRNSAIAPSVNPYNHQDHINSRNQPENPVFLQKFRKILNEYPCVTTVGEIGDSLYGLLLMEEYTKGDEGIHMCYSFEFLSGDSEGRITASYVAKILEQFTQTVPNGHPCWAFSNHDVVRHRTRWNLDRQEIELVLSLMMALPGALCLYQGEELGLTEADVSFEDIQDPYGKVFWPKFKGRDGCRTPFPWVVVDKSMDKERSGFSSNPKPWLPIPEEHIAIAQEEMGDGDGILAFYKESIAFRKSHPALLWGDCKARVCSHDVVVVTRSHEDETIMVYCNFGEKSSSLPFEENGEIIRGNGECDNHQITIAGNASVFVKIPNSQYY